MQHIQYEAISYGFQICSIYSCKEVKYHLTMLWFAYIFFIKKQVMYLSTGVIRVSTINTPHNKVKLLLVFFHMYV